MDFDVIVGTGCPYRQALLLCAVRYKMENSYKIMSINICISTNPQYKFVMYSRTVGDAGPYERNPKLLTQTIIYRPPQKRGCGFEKKKPVSAKAETGIKSGQRRERLLTYRSSPCIQTMQTKSSTVSFNEIGKELNLFFFR